MMNQATKTIVTPIVTPTIKALFNIRAEIRKLQETEKTLTHQISSYLEETRQTEIVHDGIKAMLSVCEKMTVDARKFAEKVNQADFLSAVTISVTTARKLIGDVQLRRISSVNCINQLRLSEV